MRVTFLKTIKLNVPHLKVVTGNYRRIYAYMCVCIHTHIYIYIHTRIYVYTHTYIGIYIYAYI